MTWPKHTLIQFGGKLTSAYGANEIWSCGLRVYTGSPAGFYVHDPAEYATRIGPALATWFADGGRMARTATLDVVKVNNIGPDGHYVDPVTHQFNVPGSVAGAAAAAAPSFCSVAVTWETGLSRGHAHRGRMFLPNYIFPPSGAFVDASSAAGVIATGMALLSAVNATEDSAGTLVRPIVVSSIGAGTTNEITAVSADNVYDYQSRRKNRLVSTRSSHVWP